MKMLNIEYFCEKAKEVQEMGFVKARGKGTSQVGITYEILLGKEPDAFEIPDFCGVEIKTVTKNHFQKKKIPVVKSVPDSYLFEIKRLASTYGIETDSGKQAESAMEKKEKVETKKLYVSISSRRKAQIENGYQFRLVVDRKKEEIILLVYDKDDVLIDTKARWSFELLKEKLERKFSYLAIVEAEKKIIGNETYFSYDFPRIYKLKSFEKFLRLVETGRILLRFMVGIRDGKFHDHGTSFMIYLDSIGELFERIETPYEESVEDKKRFGFVVC